MGESVGVLLGTNLPGGAQQQFKRKVAVKPSQYYSEIVLRFEVIALPRPFNVGEEC